MYGRKVEGALQDLVKALQRVVESMGPNRGDGKAGVEAEMFVGRVAIYLAKQSNFLEDLIGEANVQLSEFCI